jgi:uncharacterized membrane protein
MIYLYETIALVWFMVWVLGYAKYTNSKKGKEHSLHEVMNRHRKKWIERMMAKEDRVADTRLLDGLSRISTFFASTCIIVFFSLFRAISPDESMQALIMKIPFSLEFVSLIWFMKTVVIMSIFAFVFYKITWVLRQLYDVSTLMLACPLYPDGQTNMDDTNKNRYNAQRDQIANLVSNATRHHNIAIRGYYFGLVSITWYAHTVLFMISTVYVVWVLYRREFLSKAFDIAKEEHSSFGLVNYALR